MTDFKTIFLAFKHYIKKIIIFTLVCTVVSALLGLIYINSTSFSNGMKRDNQSSSHNDIFKKIPTEPQSNDALTIFSDGINNCNETLSLLTELKISFADKADIEMIDRLYAEQDVLREIGISYISMKNMDNTERSDYYNFLKSQKQSAYDAALKIKPENDYEELLLKYAIINIEKQSTTYNSIDEYRILKNKYEYTTAKSFYEKTSVNYNKTVDIISEVAPEFLVVKNERDGSYVIIEDYSNDSRKDVMISVCIVGFLTGVIVSVYTAICKETKK